MLDFRFTADDRTTVEATVHDMIPGSWILNAEGARHLMGGWGGVCTMTRFDPLFYLYHVQPDPFVQRVLRAYQATLQNVAISWGLRRGLWYYSPIMNYLSIYAYHVTNTAH